MYILPVQQIYRNTAGNVNGTSFSKRTIWIKTLPIIWPAFELFATMIFSASDRHSKFILNVLIHHRDRIRVPYVYVERLSDVLALKMLFH